MPATTAASPVAVLKRELGRWDLTEREHRAADHLIDADGAFEVGWMLWYTRAASWASVLNVLVTFQSRAAASAISRLVVYVATCASTLRLRRTRRANRPVFVVPFGPIVPLAAIVIALTILAGATPLQLRAGTIALAAGAVLYLVAVRGTPRANHIALAVSFALLTVG